MVILIGAESCTGKTLMAQKLLEIYKIPFLSVDLLKMGLYRADKNCGFTPTDSNEHIESHCVFMGFSQKYIEDNFTSHIIKYRSAIEQRNCPEERTIAWYVEAHKRLKLQCFEHLINYFEINNDYDVEILKVYEWIDLAVDKIRNNRCKSTHG